MRVLGVALLALAASAVRAEPTPEIQQATRAATFEVVLRKVENDPLKYEKALPLELLPYKDRTDRYWSIGTAFAIGANRFVSAAHVMLAGINSQYGQPALRDGAGHIYPVDQVLQFSLHQDYMVFSVREVPALVPLATSTAAKVDDPVQAVGNALGEGVVIRSGLYTSDTAEDQDGRWKWIRFSAAASPGNSGGPLLDAAGRVVGVVLMKSQNENLNYALPIGLVLSGSTRAAQFDSRSSFKMPMLKNSITVTLKGEFGLPANWSRFEQQYLQLLGAQRAEWRARLLQQEAASLWPRGQSDKLLATVEPAEFPQLMVQDSDAIWQSVGSGDSTDLPGDGHVVVGFHSGVLLFRIERPDHAADAAFWRDPLRFNELLLKGMKLPRIVGSESVRVTSLGKPATDTLFKDALGRVWQQRSWPLGYRDGWINLLALPTPDGYVGMADLADSSDSADNLAQLQLLTGYFNHSYTGTPAQWRAFMAEHDLLPEALARASFSDDAAHGLAFGANRFSLRVPPAVLALDDNSRLSVLTGQVAEGKGFRWDVIAARVDQDSKQRNFVSLGRQPRPGKDAGRASQQNWDDLLARRQPWDNNARTDSQLHTFWISTSFDAARRSTGPLPKDSAAVWYLTCSTDQERLPRELYSLQQQVLEGVRILEH